MNTKSITLKQSPRNFLPTHFTVSTWDALKPYFDQLLESNINTLDDLKKWLRDRSELDSAIAEDMGWRYVKMTCFTEDKTHSTNYQYFVQHIQPQLSSCSHALDQKIIECPYSVELEKQPDYTVVVRGIKEGIKLFKEENIPLFTQIDALVQDYNKVTGAMTVMHGEQEITLQKAATWLMELDRTVREEAYKKITQRRLRDKDMLDNLFSQLIQHRHQIALNAGFENFRDYMFSAYCRFDYSPADCFSFHEAIASEVVPLLNKMASQRKTSLGIESLRPWDKLVDPCGEQPLKAFSTGDELIEKAITCFHHIDPFLGECLTTMKTLKRFDVDSRKGKAPGGYNYPLPDTGVPFIFMNATSTLRDMVTILHEGGHAVHSFLNMDMELLDFKSTPMEVAELASMSMELISMDHWNIFFLDKEELRRAKKEHLEGLVETLPWVAVIDKYQHWIYENPTHDSLARQQTWNRILNEFSDDITDWSGLQEAKNYLWQKQLHLYEVPLYYIEYAIAQLGAIAVWRNYKKDPVAGLQGYMNALKLGNTRSVPELYEAAHIRFDFSKSYIRELMVFLEEEIEKI